jgi:hypothetical protein
MTEKMINLSKINKGQKAQITGFANDVTMCDMSRLGIFKGDVVTCIAKLGPIIIGKEHLKFAIGRNLSRKIYIELQH